MSIYTKTVDGWVPIVGGVAFGTPGAPTITNPEGGSVISFLAGTEGDAGQTLAYGSIITPNDNGETVVVDEEAMEVVVSGTQPFTDYVVGVYGVNLAGKGDDALTSPFQLNYNEATGGTETVVDDYNGTGETWRVHTFRSADTLTVFNGDSPFSVLLVGSGGGGGSNFFNMGGGGGGGGGVYTDASMTMTSGDYPVGASAIASLNGQSASNGAVGQGAGNGYAGGASGSPTTHGGGAGNVNVEGGGGGGSGGDGYMGVGNGGGPGGPGISRNTSGTSVTYGRGGTGGKDAQFGFNGGGFPDGLGGGVIVAYQIGTSSTTQIRNAVAVREADNAGFERGMVEGRNEREQEIVEAMQLEQEKTAAKEEDQ